MSLKTKPLSELIGRAFQSRQDSKKQRTPEEHSAIGLAAMQAVFCVVEDQLMQGHSVLIRGAGCFDLTWTPARLGHSSAKGHRVVVPGRMRVLFRPAQALRDKLRDSEISRRGRANEVEYEQELLRGLVQQQGFGGFSDSGV